MPRIVVIEGADCAGKSTLAAMLAERLSWHTGFVGHRPGDQYERYLAEYARDEYVLDRGHYSEIVYADLFGREQPFDAAQEAALARVLSHRAILIWARPDDATAQERWAVKEVAGVVQPTRAHQLLAAHRAFDALRETLALSCVIDYASKDLAEAKAVCEAVAELVGA